MVYESLSELFNFEGTLSNKKEAEGKELLLQIWKSGGNSEEDTPVPIPNTEVKLFSAEDTWRAASWEIRTSPVFLFFRRFHYGVFFSCEMNNTLLEKPHI